MGEETILVVDDGADMRDFVVNYVVRPNGYHALEASDGMQALTIIKDDPPDLILLDLQMPRLDGLGLLRRMKEDGIHIPVVLMTFFGSEEIAIEVFRLGVRDYVIKPFTDDELLEAIEGALVETRLRRTKEVIQQRLTQANDKLTAQLDDAHRLLRSRADSVPSLVKLAATCYGVTAAALITHGPEALFEEGPHQVAAQHLNEALQTGEALVHEAGLIVPVDPDTVLSVTLDRHPPDDHILLMMETIAKRIP